MPLGDSLTSGFPDDGAYRNRLYSLLTSAGYTVDFVGTQTDSNNPTLPDRDHQGLGGFRIDQIHTGLPSWLGRVADPDVVLLMVGTNDFSANFETASAGSRLSALISDIAVRRPFAKIIVASLPLRTDDANLEAQQMAFNALIPGIVSDQIALGRQVGYLDMHAVLVAADIAEGVHPSPAGYDKMADAWFPAITSVISPLGTSDPPQIARAEALMDLQQVSVTFSKPVADSAANPGNFTISGGVVVTQAVLDPLTKRTVTLTTGMQVPGTLYNLSVTGIRDRTPQQNLIAPGSSIAFSSLTLVNGGFESAETGWSMTGNRIVYNSDGDYVATEGAALLIMNAGQTPPNAIATQSFGTVPGQYYKMDFDVGILALNNGEQSLGIEVAGTAPLLSRTENLSGNALGNSVWSPRSYSFIADSSTTTLTVRDLSPSTDGRDLLLDNIRIVAAFPPPNTAPVATSDSYSTSRNTPLVVAAPGVLANDSDAQSDPITAELVTGPAHGGLVLNANGNFTYTPSPGYTGPDSFTYLARDGSVPSNLATVSITIAPPSLFANGSFEEDEDGWTMTGNRIVYASDGTYIAFDGSKMAIFNAGNSTPDAVISQSFDTTPGQTYQLTFHVGILAVSGVEQRLQFAVNGSSTLLTRTETLTGNSQGNSVWSARSYSFTADSGNTTLVFADISPTTLGADLLLDKVGIVPVLANRPPVAAADFHTSAPDTPLVVAAPGVLANDSDADADPLSAAIAAGPVHGNVVLNPDGSFTYTPAAGYTGEDSFTYRANDGAADSNIVTVSISVEVPPLLANGGFESGETGWSMTGNRVVYQNDGTYIAYEGTRMAIFNAGNSTPNAVVAQTFATVPGTAYTVDFHVGILALNTSDQVLQLTVTGATAPFVRTETLTGNGLGDSVWTARSYSFIAAGTSAMLTFADLSATTELVDLMLDNVRLTAEPTGGSNTPPVAAVDSYLLDQNGILEVPASGVLTNDTDADSDPLSAALVAGPTHGTLVFGSDGGFTYTPTPGYTGGDSFIYTANDGEIDSNAVTVSLTINPLNTAPVAMADSYTVAQDGVLVVAASGVLANDTDAQSDPLTAVVGSGPSHGNLTLGSNGGFTYTPATGYSGPDSFTYVASDGGLDSASTTVSLTVTPVLAQILVNGSFEFNYSGWTSTGNQAIESYLATDGTKRVAFNGRDLAPNAILTQTFATVVGQTYTLAFDLGVLSYVKKQQRISLTVSGNSNLLSQTITLTGAGTGGTQWTPRSFTFIADSASTTLSFRDRSSTTSGIDLLLDHVRVTGPSPVVNAAPVAVADSYSVNKNTVLAVPAAGVLTNDVDPQSNTLTAVLDSPPVHGTVSLASSGSFTYTPAANYVGTDFFTYHANDGSLDSAVVAVNLLVNEVSPGILANPSFESDFNGWTISGNQAISYYPATDGIKIVAFNGDNRTPDAVLSQTFATLPGQTYSLVFDTGLLSYTTDSQSLRVTVTGASSLLDQTVTLNGEGNGLGPWIPQNFTFLADSTSTTLAFRDQSTATVGIDLLLDHVRVQAIAAPAAVQTAAVPGSPPVLTGAPMLTSTPDAREISMIAPEAGTYVFQISDDLRVWQSVDQLECEADDLIRFYDSHDALGEESSVPRKFYRIGLEK